ncbi:branched-chain amino acid aminotransferase/4-amino-4-deoxychorismate lyase [Verrucomicrobium sp. GAS474]|uniref:aminotransferase class IV n=1 Tax=Verrucomicrobium sp. GAS474 TaxID=1882831 RepID=UPI000879B829|nr:aminotransferase class IV [Verrucomicrobium sp. GAS474]SDU21495.1 branched-chain amino acid aminotransferase/4-amino-4-deoxychorismate lyase [Verrucomicrobium sp. GAS474]
MKTFLPWLGVFETLRVEAGRPLLLEEHLASLREAAEAVGLVLPAEFRDNLHEKASRLPGDTGRWRWIVDSEGGRALFTHEPGSPLEHFRVRIAPERVGSMNWDARYKTLSYLTHWQARKSAEAAGHDEGLLLNENGYLASGAMTNLFWVRKGQIHTPALDCGCRNGAVRRWIFAQFSGKPGKIVEGYFPPSVLEEAEEIFLTNSWIGIRPVIRLDGWEISPGPVTRKLAGQYRADLKI